MLSVRMSVSEIGFLYSLASACTMQAELELLLDAELRNAVTLTSKQFPLAALVQNPFFLV
jgi:hypothetical protein